MKGRAFLVTIVSLMCAAAVSAQEAKSIQLPPPVTQGGKPLMQALAERKTGREFSTKSLEPQTLSDLLWAAFGVNRPESKGRTAPSAMNAQEIDIYVALATGLYRYDPFTNTLEFISAQDIRPLTGRQDFVKDAPVNLIFVADFSRAARFGDKREFYAACDTGFISQNIYLFCASSGLATVVRGLVDEQALSGAMGLSAAQKIILTQTVGYPK